MVYRWFYGPLHCDHINLVHELQQGPINTIDPPPPGHDQLEL